MVGNDLQQNDAIRSDQMTKLTKSDVSAGVVAVVVGGWWLLIVGCWLLVVGCWLWW